MSSGAYLLLGLGLLALALLGAEYFKSRWQAQPYDLHEAALLFVQAAEQMFPGQTGGAKLTWVIAQLQTLGFAHLDATFLRAAIEAAVFAVKQRGGYAKTGGAGLPQGGLPGPGA